MKQITLAIIFVALMFGTFFAFDSPKCNLEMVEKDGLATCSKCGFSAKISRTKIYKEPTVEEKMRTIEQEKGIKLKNLDENPIRDVSKVKKDAEYDSKIERIKELKNRIERWE